MEWGLGLLVSPNPSSRQQWPCLGLARLLPAVEPVLSSGCPRPTLPSILYLVLLPWHGLCSLGTA